MEKIIFLVGPTAVGKSEVAVALAKKLNAEIISCDSMQVYKGMEIISSQPQRSLLKKIPHHLLGIIPPSREYNVSGYRGQALKKISEILKKGKIPLFAGGTGLYMSIVIDGIFPVRAQDARLRQKFYKQAERFGSRLLYERLNRVDPQAAEKIHPNDTRRIIRALEVFEITGKPISQLQKLRKGITDKYDVKIFCLNMPREKLYKRIANRVEKMFKAGLTGEVKHLLSKKLGNTAKAAIGIKELKGYFDGEYDLSQAKRLIVRNTCLYSKRQLTWFRKDKRIKWIEIGENETAEEIADKMGSDLFFLNRIINKK